MDYHEQLPEQDERAWQDDLAGERQERILNALYNAAMIGVPEDDLRVLCSECGLTYADLEHFTPHVLRPRLNGGGSTLSLPF